MKILPYSRFLSEESPGYAKLQSKKFRKITYNAEEKAIMKDDEKAAITGVRMYFEENPEDEEAYYSIFDNIRNPRFVESGGFELFYSFSNSIRGSRKYGNPNWSARFLYEFICAAYNGGDRFVDTYFNYVFTSRPVYRALVRIVENVQDAIETKWNDGNLKGGQWASFYKFQAAEMSGLRNDLEDFSTDIRQDIITCLGIGLIPLRFSLAPATLKKRQQLNLGTTPFYATTWLIHQITVHVILGDLMQGNLHYSDNYTGDR